MKRLRSVGLALAVVIMVLLSSRSRDDAKKVLPLVNDVNCKDENVARIADKETREQFGSLCMRRGTFKPTPSKDWTVKP